MSPHLKIPLDKNWHFRQTSHLANGTTSSAYLPVSRFPTVAHLDLLSHGLIPDPYIDTNELDCLWVNDADWSYRTTFASPGGVRGKCRAVLVFDGLDTVVEVFLNGQLVLESVDMHVGHRVDVTELLMTKGTEDGKGEGEEGNVLELRFSNAPAFAR